MKKKLTTWFKVEHYHNEPEKMLVKLDVIKETPTKLIVATGNGQVASYARYYNVFNNEKAARASLLKHLKKQVGHVEKNLKSTRAALAYFTRN